MASSRKKITTIMFTDMVGYSKMVARDENSALTLLEEHNQLIFPFVEKSHGRIIKLIGDAVFAEFNSPLQAMESARQIQEKLRERNTIIRKEQKIHIRIGLHCGEVIEKDDDLFGHDVNLGSRIEGVTQPDCISVSEDVHQALEKGNDFYFREIGHVKLKNIPQPKRLYKLYLDLLDYNGEKQKDLQAAFREKGVEIVDIEKYEVEKIIPIAVLYFSNIGAESDEYISHSFSMGLVKSLQSIDLLRVPSVTEVIKFRGTELPESEIARRLHVNQYINGTILVKDSEAIINIDIYDSEKGKILWSKEFKSDISQLKQVQNQIISKICELHEITIPSHLMELFKIKTTDNVHAEKEYQKARFLLDVLKKKDNLQKAEVHLRKAIELDPTFLYAHTQLGKINYRLGYFELAEEQLYFALEIAKQDGTSLSDGYVYSTLGPLYNLWGKYKKAMKYNKMALEVYSQLEFPLAEATTIHNLAISYRNLGEHKEALKYYQKSLDIKKKYEDRLLQASSYAQIGNIHLIEGEYSTSISNLKQSLAIYRDFGHTFNEGRVMLIITEAYLKVGELDIAQNLINDADNLLSEYDDPTILGTSNVYKGILAFYKTNKSNAIEYITNGIEQYQNAQKQAQAFENNLLLAQIHIFYEEFNLVENILTKIITLEKHIQDKELLQRASTLRWFIASLQERAEPECGEKIIDNLRNSDENLYLSWWYMALGNSLNNNKDIATNCLNASQELLHQKCLMISDIEHQKKFLSINPIHKQIMEQTSELLSTFTDTLKFPSDKPEISKFCGECGFQNTDYQPFCPECGNKLKK